MQPCGVDAVGVQRTVWDRWTRAASMCASLSVLTTACVTRKSWWEPELMWSPGKSGYDCKQSRVDGVGTSAAET